MGQTINIYPPELAFGSFGVAKCQVDIIENGSPVSTRYYYFAVNQFSSIADSVAPNYATIHFGKHSLDVSNGLYTSYFYNGGAQASAYALVIALSVAVGDLVP